MHKTATNLRQEKWGWKPYSAAPAAVFISNVCTVSTYMSSIAPSHTTYTLLHTFGLRTQVQCQIYLHCSSLKFMWPLCIFGFLCTFLRHTHTHTYAHIYTLKQTVIINKHHLSFFPSLWPYAELNLICCVLPLFLFLLVSLLPLFSVSCMFNRNSGL